MVKVTRSTIIDAPIAAVWAILRDFNSHSGWHPAVSASRIEAGRASDEIGCVRDFALADGGGLREQLLSLSDRDHTLSYCILDAPMPLQGYVASIRLKPVTDGDRTFWSWESRFDTPPGREEELTQLVGEGIYEAGFAAVKRMLARGNGLKPPRPPSPASAVSVRRLPAARGETLRAGAIIVSAYGGADRMTWQEIAVPPPGPGEVRLRHTAIGVNYIDIYCRTGYFDLLTPPGVLGMEAAGIVLDVGDGVPNLSPGDRVGYACPPVGAYCELRTMDASLLVALPDHIDDRLAAAVLLKGMSAEFLLHRVHKLREGQTILVQAAAGGVGQLLCQWARALGATVIGTVGSREKARIAQGAGCAHTIVYTEEDFIRRVDADHRRTRGGRRLRRRGPRYVRQILRSTRDPRPPRQLRSGLRSGPAGRYRQLCRQVRVGFPPQFRPLHRYAGKGPLDHGQSVPGHPHGYPPRQYRADAAASGGRGRSSRSRDAAYIGLDYPDP